MSLGALPLNLQKFIVLTESTRMTKGKAKQAIAKVAAPAKKVSTAAAAPKEVIKPVEKAAAKAPTKMAKKLPEKVAAKAPAKKADSKTTALVKPVKSAKSIKPANPAKPAKAEKSARALTGEGTPPAQAPAAPADAKLERKLASNPPRALNSPIRIFQIYYEPWQRCVLLQPPPLERSLVSQHVDAR